MRAQLGDASLHAFLPATPAVPFSLPVFSPPVGIEPLPPLLSARVSTRWWARGRHVRASSPFLPLSCLAQRRYDLSIFLLLFFFFPPPPLPGDPRAARARWDSSAQGGPPPRVGTRYPSFFPLSFQITEGFPLFFFFPFPLGSPGARPELRRTPPFVRRRCEAGPFLFSFFLLLPAEKKTGLFSFFSPGLNNE